MYIYGLSSQTWKSVDIPQHIGTHSAGTYNNTESAGFIYMRKNQESHISIFDLKNEEWQPKDDLIEKDVNVYDIINIDGKTCFITQKNPTHNGYWRFYDKELRILNESNYIWEKTIALPFDHYEQIFEYENELYFLNSSERLFWRYDPELH